MRLLGQYCGYQYYVSNPEFKVEPAVGSLQAWEEVGLGETRAGVLPGEHNRGVREGVEKRQKRSKTIRIVVIPGRSLEKGSRNLIWPIGTMSRFSIQCVNCSLS